MITVLLRLKGLTQRQVGALYDATWVEKLLGKFVTVKNSKFDNEGIGEVDLKVDHYHARIPPDGKVTLEMLGELFEIFGIFPKPKSVFTDEELKEILVGINEAATAAHRLLDRIPLNNKAVDDIVAAKANLHQIQSHCTMFGLKYGVCTEHQVALNYQFVLEGGSPTDESVEREAKKLLGDVNITKWCVVDDRHFFGAVHGRGRKPEDPPLIYVEYTKN